MGNQIHELFVKAEAIGGIKAKTQLSLMTKIFYYQAKTVPDSPENLAMCKQALDKIAKEFKDGSSIQTTVTSNFDAPLRETSDAESTMRLRKHITIFIDLVSHRTLHREDLAKTYQRITEAIVSGIGVERASIWLYDKYKSQIRCEDLYINTTRTHSSGTVLMAKDFPNYFTAIKLQKTIAAHDAHTDARTKEFSTVYLKPLGINSMLDVPIWVNNEMVGVVCHEHIGPKRTWNKDEENFAYLMSNLIATAMETAK